MDKMYLLWLVLFSSFCGYVGCSVWWNMKHARNIASVVEKTDRLIKSWHGYIRQHERISTEITKKETDKYQEMQSKILSIKAKLESEGESILQRANHKQPVFPDKKSKAEIYKPKPDDLASD